VDLGLDGVLLLGSMGEGPLLPESVRCAFVEIALAEVGERLTIFVSAADVSRERMRERALQYAGMGAHCVVLCLPPRVSLAKAMADVKTVADVCPVPCAYYEVPANTGIALTLHDLLDILKHGNIKVIKDSSENALIAQSLTSKEHRPKGIAILDGCEYRTAYSAALNYDGVLHGGGVLTGRWARDIWNKMKQGQVTEAFAQDREKALFLAAVYNRFARQLQNTMGQKYALKLLGVMDHETVVVDQTLDDASRRRIEAAIAAQRAWL
jgi:dihydrodipicolinate synthase/N-acetylneuraminate lyase